MTDTITVSGPPGMSAYQLYALNYLAAHGNDPTGMLSVADYISTSGGNLQPQIDLVNAGTATAVAAAAGVQAINTGRAEDTPNLFTRRELSFKDLTTRFSASGTAALTRERHNNRLCLKVVASGAGETVLTWTIDRADFINAVASASLWIEEMTAAGSPGTNSVRVRQLTAGGGVISDSAITVLGTGAQGAAVRFPIENVALDAACAKVLLRVGLFNRTAWLRDLYISSATEGTFTPVERPTPNWWPDPEFSGNRATTIAATGTVSISDGTDGITAGTLVRRVTGAGTMLDRYAVPASESFAPGNRVVFSADVYSDAAGDDTAAIALLFLGADGVTEIASRIEKKSHDVAGTWQFKSVSGTIPAGTAFVGYWLAKRVNAVDARFANPDITPRSPPKSFHPYAFSPMVRPRIWCAASGAGDGRSYGSPMAISKALLALQATGGTLELTDGDHVLTAALSLDANGPITLRGVAGTRPRLLNALSFTVFTPTPGYAGVYSVALASGSLPERFAFIHDVPSSPITRRHPLQRGLAYGEPCLRLRPLAYRDGANNFATAATVGSLDLLYASAGGFIWYDLDAQRLHFKLPGGADPTGQTLMVPRRTNVLQTTAVSGYGENVTRVENLDLFYGSRNLIIANGGVAELDDVFGYGAGQNGFLWQQARRIEAEMLRASGAGLDCAGGHVDAALGNKWRVQEILRTCWFGWSWDDAWSSHELHDSVLESILAQNAGDRGFVAASGCKAIANNCDAFDCGQLDGAIGGEGFTVVNAVAAPDTSIGTALVINGGTSIGNPVNYGCGPRTILAGATDANHLVDVRGGRSLDAGIAGFYANQGTLTVRGCTHGGSGAAKLTENGGTIVVANGATVA